MPARNNAMSELVRFWLESRHGCLVKESVPVKVPHNYSDIDLVAVRPDLQPWNLPDGTPITRAIVETKDEHDFDKHGTDFGKRLKYDHSVLGSDQYTPKGEKVNFSMLRAEHYEEAKELFGTDEFDRIFVVHALNQNVRDELCPGLKDKRIHFLTIKEVIKDIQFWYVNFEKKSTLRNTLVGDMWYLLFGYCSDSLKERN